MKQKHYYTDEKNAQIVIALLKEHGIRDIVISPGATNDCFVLSVQDDPDFMLYSAVDERHAGYLACGLAEEKGVPVVINCTGATSSRNYMSALTEAYYRKLPILALTCSQHSSHFGNMYPQMTDRFHPPSDVVKLSVQCSIPHTEEECWSCNLKVNQALLELTRRGGGPVHVNLETSCSGSYTIDVLPPARKVTRIVYQDSMWPEIQPTQKIVIWVGSHRPFSTDELSAVDAFVKSYNAVILGDLTSNCKSGYFVAPSLLGLQSCVWQNPMYSGLKPDLIIHIGEISGDYPSIGLLNCGAPVWRVSQDGELRDPFHTLTHVFEMREDVFFRHYNDGMSRGVSYAQHWRDVLDGLKTKKPEIPFSGLYISEKVASAIPSIAELHLGILNPLRCANLSLPDCRKVFCNVGGFGIDGNVSSLLGASIAHPDELYVGIVGDLSFFYDMNSLGSRHLGKNIRLLIVNNGEGGEFLVPGNISDNPNCGERVHDYIAARGHYGRQSKKLIKNMVDALGLRYLSASNKDELAIVLPEFLRADGNSSVVLECFTESQNDRIALAAYSSIEEYAPPQSLKSAIGSMLPENMRNVIKRAMGR